MNREQAATIRQLMAEIAQIRYHNRLTPNQWISVNVPDTAELREAVDAAANLVAFQYVEFRYTN